MKLDELEKEIRIDINDWPEDIYISFERSIIKDLIKAARDAERYKKALEEIESGTPCERAVNCGCETYASQVLAEDKK